MAELHTHTGSGKNVKNKSSNRRSTRVDLTPMVDLGFLLITFFVFTTTMARPTTLDLLEPMEGKQLSVGASGAMTIILSKDHTLFYYHGLLSNANIPGPIYKTDLKNIRQLILQKKLNTDLSKLMFIIKGEVTSTYGDNIDLLDEMFICQIPAGHFAEAEMDDEERKLTASR
jgi:biopolymer transport protein ExbD